MRICGHVESGKERRDQLSRNTAGDPVPVPEGPRILGSLGHLVRAMANVLGAPIPQGDARLVDISPGIVYSMGDMALRALRLDGQNFGLDLGALLYDLIRARSELTRDLRVAGYSPASTEGGEILQRRQASRMAADMSVAKSRQQQKRVGR
jgi:hypothetical protein